MHSYTDVHIYIYMYSTYIHTYKENKLKAPDISHIILYCVVFIHTHIYRYALFYCALLYCSLQIIIVCLTDWRFVAVLLYADLSPPFPNSICSLYVSLSHFGNFCNIPNFLIIIIIFVLVTTEQMVVVWEHHKLCPYKIADSVNKCVLTALSSSHSVSLPLLGPPCSLRQNNLGMRPVDNPTVASKHTSERKSLTLLTLSQRLERLGLVRKVYQKLS